MPKIILFVILEQYADWEAAYTASFINTLGGGAYTVKTVSLKKEALLSIGGFTALPDYSLDTVPNDFEALILIGGMSWRKESALRVKPLVEKALKSNKLVGGICDASAFLGVIGALNNSKHTSNWLEGLKEWAGSAYTGEENYLAVPAVYDKNIVTANGTAALEFAKEILNALHIAPKERVEEWYCFHKLGAHQAPMPKI